MAGLFQRKNDPHASRFGTAPRPDRATVRRPFVVLFGSPPERPNCGFLGASGATIFVPWVKYNPMCPALHRAVGMPMATARGC